MEASITALTASNQYTKSQKKDATVHTEGKDQREESEDEKSKPVQAQGTESPVHEHVVVKDEVTDHPLAVKEDEVQGKNHPQTDKDNVSAWGEMIVMWEYWLNFGWEWHCFSAHQSHKVNVNVTIPGYQHS